MVENIGAQFVSPQHYWQQQMQQGGWQQQLWGGQMGTRGADIQGQVGQQQPGLGMPQQVNLSPHEKAVLRCALDFLKEGRVALATGVVDPQVAQRLTAAHAFLCGFLEARGLGEPGAYLRSIPQARTLGTVSGDPRYDQFVDNFEQFLRNEGQTRFAWGALIGAIPVAIDAAKWIYKKATH